MNNTNKRNEILEVKKERLIETQKDNIIRMIDKGTRIQTHILQGDK